MEPGLGLSEIDFANLKATTITCIIFLKYINNMTREESKWNNTNAQSNPPKLEKDGKAKAETKNKSNKLKKKKRIWYI